MNMTPIQNLVNSAKIPVHILGAFFASKKPGFAGVPSRQK
jgi:hypothetical protein